MFKVIRGQYVRDIPPMHSYQFLKPRLLQNNHKVLPHQQLTPPYLDCNDIIISNISGVHFSQPHSNSR